MKVMGFAGWSGSGKTTLVEQVIGVLSARGLVVSLVKHAHHSLDIDHAGKDSWRHRQAGCSEVMVSSAQRWSLTRELRGAPEATLDELLAHLGPCDLVLVEGFKRAPIPKIEVHRAAVTEPLLHRDDPYIVAIATDTAIATALPRLDINDPAQVADFIVARLALPGGGEPERGVLHSCDPG